MINRMALGAMSCLLACALASGDNFASDAGQKRTAAQPPEPGNVFPLRAEAGKRYLVKANGGAFLLNGDTAWSLIAELTREEVDLYLEDRARRGFNAILVNLLERRFATNAPSNRYGAAPFTTPGDYSTPNERYFEHADYVVRKAAEQGILVLLAPSYLGFRGGNQGWYREMIANGAAKLRGYGRFLGKRYRNYSNILWVHGGDFNPPDKSVVREIALGIRDLDGRALHTVHGAPETAALQYWAGESWLTVNNIYTRKPAYLAGREEHRRSEMPFFLIEGRYEDEAGSEGSEHRMRVQAYQALLSGATGHLFGNNPVWHFSGPGLYPAPHTWQQSLNSPGARSITSLHSLLSARAWWTLVPNPGQSFIAGDAGSGHDRAIAARSDDRSFAIAYLPSARTMRVDLGQLAGPRVEARWYDPSAGTYSSVAGSPFRANGVRSFNPPGRNASGFGDWVLLLESGNGR